MSRDFTTTEAYNFTVSSAECRGNAKNCNFPNELIIKDQEGFTRVCQQDHVLGVFKNHYRSVKNFIKADALGMDCDNDHSDNPADWKTPEDVHKAFKDVPFYVCYSRNHMKKKKGKSARPRFHIIFPIDEMTDSTAYAALKKQVHTVFPFFDGNALDAARLFFGTADPQVEFYAGSVSLNTYLQVQKKKIAQEFSSPPDEEIIPEGKRNATLHKFAVKIIKRYGDTAKAWDHYLSKTLNCEPPLDEDEIDRIWDSAAKYYHAIIEQQDDYIPPEAYDEEKGYEPEDYSDVGQAEVLARVFGKELKFTKGTGYMRYNGVIWVESKQRAQAAAQELTALQLKETRENMLFAWKKLRACGAAKLIEKMGEKKAEKEFNPTQKKAYDEFIATRNYYRFVVKRRESKNITATLREAQPMLEMNISEFDSDAYLLNTPDYTIDLRKGMKGIREHRVEDYITKTTLCSPSKEGIQQWSDALKKFFQKDVELERYVQDINGLAVVGRVYVEFMVVAHGGGRNGKSTFWNTISALLGSYSGKISADTLTVGIRRNVKPELAETNGKRLLIASELEEGKRLNTSTIKQFCSTDEIFAEKKYKDPFTFTPSHTLVLYTNHLPKVGANDPGTWRRLVVVPFNATIEGNDDILNYTQYLIENCGGAVLAWVIEGAKRIIANNFKLTQPDCVTRAISAYREDNDWLDHFITDRCDAGEDLQEKSGQLFSAYRSYCSTTGEYTRSTTDFYAGLEFAGFKRKKTNKGSFVLGLKLNPVETAAIDDFLP
jgi:putative DNA primase/helicase